jgi:5-methylcytosine-specific restriction endonuclease McrA
MGRSLGAQQAASARRRAINEGWFKVMRGDLCSYCGSPGGTVDHITPIVLGGGNDDLNLAGACSSCNSRKGSTPLVFASPE